MDLDYEHIKLWVLPAIILAGATVLGFIVQRLLMGRLKTIAERTSWQGDEIIVYSLRGMTVFWFMLLGLWQAMQAAELTEKQNDKLEKVLLVCLILSVTMVLARLTKGFVNLSMTTEGTALPSASILSNLARILIYVIGILVVLNRLGISITPMLTALGVGGLAVALALQDTLSNLFAGIQILLSRQIRPGDFIRLDNGEDGFVEDITLRNTTIRKAANNILIIPNSKLANTIVTNYYLRHPELSVPVPVGVSYDSDLEKVERITLEVARQTLTEVPGAVPDFEPLIRYNEFADSSINFNVILRAAQYTDQFLLKHEFIKRLHKRYTEEGIEIPFPVRTVYLKNGKGEKI